jgi:flagellar protein FlgJ
MPVNGLGSLFLDNNQMSAESFGTLTRTGLSEGRDNSFETLLKRLGESEKPDTEKMVESTEKANSTETKTIPLSHTKPHIDKTDKLYEQCAALETFIVKTLLSGMRNTVQKSGLVDEGFAGKMYEDMLWDERAKDFTKNANFGLADLAYLELTGQRGKLIERF